MNKIDIFPTPVGIDDLKLDDTVKNEILDYFFNFNVDNHMFNIANSDIDSHHLLDKNLPKLKDLILKSFYEYSKHDTKFNITTSWIKILRPGKDGHIHCHRNCMYSGIFYFDDSEANLVLHQTNIGSYYIENTEQSSEQFWITPKKHRIVFFPSNVWHSVNTNTAKLNRVSLAFNLAPVPPYGVNDSYLK